MSIRVLWVIEYLGIAAVIVLSSIVVYLNDGAIWGTLVWLMPLILLIEFGCFAHQDRIHKEKESHDRV